jgi:P27 family predicted phage terminase small subunit
MGERGPRPEPTALKILKGNPGRRPLNLAEPRPRQVAPRPPSHLDPDARREWNRIIRELTRLGLATTLDRAALAGYCVAWSRWKMAEENIAKYGVVIKSPSGYPIHSPYLSIANMALKQLHALLCEFGMSPASRTQIETAQPHDLGGSDEPEKDTPQDPYDAFRARQRALRLRALPH